MDSGTLSFVCHGARFLIRAQESTVLKGLRDSLPPGTRIKQITEPDISYSLLMDGSGLVLFRGAEELARFTGLSPALARLSSDLHFQVALHARRRLFVHAGTVAWRGRAIVLPGRTMAGKSTLVEALVREGATYFSDEYAVLDRAGLVRPYRKPISRRESRAPDPGRPSSALDGPDPGPVPLGLIVMTRYRSRATFRPRTQTPGGAFLSLLDNTVVARLRPRFAMNVLGRAVPGARAIVGDRGEAPTAAEKILALASRHQSPGKEEECVVPGR